MDGQVLIAYASKHGSTLEVAEAVGTVLREAGLQTTLCEASRVQGLDRYDAVVLGAPIYMMRWHRAAHRFLRKHRGELEGKPLAVFALGPLHEEEAEWTKARGVLAAAFKADGVEPDAVEVFGGKVDPAELHFPLSKMPEEDARDWVAIAAWAAGLPQLLSPAVPA